MSKYLDKLQVRGGNLNTIKNNIYHNSFPNGEKTFDLYKNSLRKNIPTKNKCNVYTQKEWIDCNDTCNNIVSELMNLEMESTAYMLRVLSNSIISCNKNEEFIEFSYTGEDDGKKLTGKWKNDENYFNIIKLGKNENKPKKLIFGFGPSASGKTYWARNIIDILNEVDKNVPKTFISIDGGDFRSYCETYQATISIIKEKEIGGFNNLVLSSFSLLQSSLFDSNIIKSEIIKFLNRHKEHQINISLYIPETLGDCGGMTRAKGCYSKLKKYIEITGDNDYISLLIYQHKTDEECIMDIPYQCIGCTASGLTRQTDEGKKYSNVAYEHSITQGYVEIRNSPNLKFVIHNSGGKKTNNSLNKSVLIELSKKSIFTESNIKKIEKTYNCVYSYNNHCNS